MNVDYWKHRYETGGTSGAGSYGEAGWWKAQRVNQWHTGSVLDLGCGDGNVATMFAIADYLGVDIPVAVELAQARNPHLSFVTWDDDVTPRDTHLSLDVIYHLVNDDDYWQHMWVLFAANRRVIVHSSDFDRDQEGPHMRHRNWTADVPPGWTLTATNPGDWSHADLYIYDRTSTP